MLEHLTNIRAELVLIRAAQDAALTDPDRDAPEFQDTYAEADVVAELGGATLMGLASEAEPDLVATGIDPDSVGYMPGTPPVLFIRACRKAAVTLKYWQDYSDQETTLLEVGVAAADWLAWRQGPIMAGDTVRAALKDAQAVKADAAAVKLASRVQRSGMRRGNHQRAQTARQRATAARHAAGTGDILAAARILAGTTLVGLAAVYGYDDLETFQAEAMDNRSALRRMLARDSTSK